MRTFQIFHLSGASRYLLSHAVGLYALESRIQALCLTPAEAVVMARLLYLEMSPLLYSPPHRDQSARFAPSIRAPRFALEPRTRPPCPKRSGRGPCVARRSSLPALGRWRAPWSASALPTSRAPHTSERTPARNTFRIRTRAASC